MLEILVASSFIKTIRPHSYSYYNYSSYGYSKRDCATLLHSSFLLLFLAFDSQIISFLCRKTPTSAN